MDIDMAPPTHTLREGKSVTFTEVAKKIAGLSSDQRLAQFKGALDSFRTFLTHEEEAGLSKDQLKVLRSRFVYVLEECTRHPDGTVDKVLPAVTAALDNVSNELESSERGIILSHPNAVENIESVVDKAFEIIDTQLRKVMLSEDEERSNIYREELNQAQANDRKRIAELEGIVEELRESHETFERRVQGLIPEQQKIIGNKSEAPPRQEPAKQALALIADLTGKSLPPSTPLDRVFVTIEKAPINQGKSYDIFLGEYFTGEKIAIQVLRQRVSGDTVQKMHEHFAHQTTNWAALRHNIIIPFYGMGVMESPFSEGEFQLLGLLTRLEYQQYLKKYEETPSQSRLQMVYDIARGLQYMHEESGLGKNGLIHSALNPIVPRASVTDEGGW